jgi:hypothetical protein
MGPRRARGRGLSIDLLAAECKCLLRVVVVIRSSRGVWSRPGWRRRGAGVGRYAPPDTLAVERAHGGRGPGSTLLTQASQSAGSDMVEPAGALLLRPQRKAGPGPMSQCPNVPKQDPKAIVTAARSLFPEHLEGPDFLWYALPRLLGDSNATSRRRSGRTA